MEVLKDSSKEKIVLLKVQHPMKNAYANEVIVPQSTTNNGAIESKSSIDELDLGEKVSPSSRQHSMRKSKVLGEPKRDVALSTVQSSLKLPMTTPLNPVTPLRWKSTKRIEFERKKLQEEIRTKEVVMEEEKNMTLANEEMKDESKMERVSRGVNGMKTFDEAIESPTSNHFTSQEDKMFTPSANTTKCAEMPSIHQKVEDPKHFHPITNGSSNKYVEHCEQVSSLTSKHELGEIGNNSRTERKPHIRDESNTNTIDFLRARLLAERASSKIAKEHIQQLTKKVQELEDKLNQELQSSHKAKEVEREAIMKVTLLSECKVSSPRMNEALFQHEQTNNDLHVQELNQDGKCQVFANMKDTRSNATMDIEPNLNEVASLEANDFIGSEVEAIPKFKQETSDFHCIQSFDKRDSSYIKCNGIATIPSITSTNGDISSTTNLEFKQQEIRLCIEERLQKMWNQMAAATSTLVEDNTIDDCTREGLLKWMHQFPIVVQNILPKHSETVKDCPLDELSHGDGCETHKKDLKNVPSLIEKFEAKDGIQEEYEQSKAMQNLTSKQYNNQGSLTLVNSDCGILLSIKPQETHQQEVEFDEPPKHLLQREVPSCSFATNSLISNYKDMSVEGLLETKDNDGTSIHTNGDNIPSTYPNSHKVGDEARQSSGEKIASLTTHGTLNPNSDQTKFGLRGSMNASLVTPPFPTSSFIPKIQEKRGDINIILDDKLQLLKESNHEKPLNRNCLNLESHSKGSGEEMGELKRLQVFSSWVNQEEVCISPTLINTRDDSSIQWDAPIRGKHLQHGRLAPYSQAGNSNAYIRPNHYPVRNGEREIYRGRMESVSRSMEGLGSSWRSSSDGEGDEMFEDIPDSTTSSMSRKFGLQTPYQVNGGSRWFDDCQLEKTKETFQSYPYSSQLFPKENFQSQSTANKMENTSSEVNEVLKALQQAKLSIRNFKARRPTNSIEPRYVEGDKHNMRMDYNYSNCQITNYTSNALCLWSHPETSNYSRATFAEVESTTTHLHPSNSMPFGMLLDIHRKYPQDRFLIR